MRLSFFNSDFFSDESVKRTAKKLSSYKKQVDQIINDLDDSKPEYSLAHAAQFELHQLLAETSKRFSKVKHVVLVGIGGSSLGLEAVHSVLNNDKVKLSVLDTVSPYEMKLLLDKLAKNKVKEVVVCVISKSGGTTETLVNASIVLKALNEKWGSDIYTQTIFIGDDGTDFLKTGKKLGATTYTMPKIVGGRYCVGTEAALIPMTLLGHDVDAFIAGFTDASKGEYESLVAESATLLYLYIQKGFKHNNFFAFEKRLATLGAWYRQLFAESLGKSKDSDGKEVNKGMLPTISTPVELHSVGQLYLSGFSGVYTDFVTFDDVEVDFDIPKSGLAKTFAHFSAQEIITAIYGGVIGAYKEKSLPFRTTIFEDEHAYDLGLFMAMRLRETMYIAHLMNLNAFDQPNVELYKTKTKSILGL